MQTRSPVPPPEPWLFLAFHALVASTVVAVVALTGHAPGHERLLAEASRESGPFELGSSLVLLVAAGYSARVLLRERREQRLRPLFRLGVALLVPLCLVAALEELSWGQHLLGLEPGEFFLRHNRQRELNLHNLLPAKLFNGLIDTGSYVLFVFLPLFLLFQGHRERVARWVESGFVPYGGSLHDVLVFGFGFALQAYGEPLAASDTVALGVAYLLIALLLVRRPALRTPAHVTHFVLLVAATLFFVAHRHLFAFANLQYEIRELVFAYALLHVYAGWVRARRATGVS